MFPTPRQAVLTALAMTALIAVLAGCTPAVLVPQPEGQDASAQGTATGATAPIDPGALPFHESTEQVKGDERAVVTTSRGVFTFAFYAKKAPNTVATFIELARQGFFDGTKFHRVEPGLLIQGGDPLSRTDDPATGTGGPPWRLKAEFNDEKHVEGTVAMARTNDLDTAGSQFYVGISPMPSLDGQYTVFGHVVKGMDVVRTTEVGDVIESVKISRGK